MPRYLLSLLRLCLVLPLLWAGALGAQSYPEYNATTVNDYAGLLDAAAEQRLEQQLSALRSETGVEMTVLTLSRQDLFAPDQTLEAFATGLFDAWGIGDKTRNDGVLVMVLLSDRAMRIELGSAYGHDWDRAAARIIDRSFLPAFKEDRYQDGIEAGVSDTIDSLITPFLAGDAPPKDRNILETWLIVMATMAAIGLLAFKDRIKDLFVGLKKCPDCGQRQLQRVRRVNHPATHSNKGDGDVITECMNCSYRTVVPYTIGRLRSTSSTSTFDGGSSGGGGASGKW